MSPLQLVVGIALLALGATCAFGRERIVVGHRGRAARTVQAPMTYLVMGVVLALAGIIQVVLALG